METEVDPQESHWRFDLPSSTRQLGPLRARLRRILRGLSLPEATVHDLVLATNEAVVNAMVHGNGLDETRPVELTLQVVEGALMVEVRDQGPGFNWREWVRRARDRKTNPEALQGRGILVMTTVVDEIAYHDPGNLVRLIKRHAGPR